MELVKKQVYLTPAQDLAIRQRAHTAGISESEVVRRALETFFLNTKEGEKENAFTSLIGAGNAKPGHSSDSIDIDLYGGDQP